MANQLLNEQWGDRQRNQEINEPGRLPQHFVIRDAEQDRAVVAYGKLNHGDGKDGQQAAIWSVVVSPTVRRMGVGRRLLLGLEQEARECGKVTHSNTPTEPLAKVSPHDDRHLRC